MDDEFNARCFSMFVSTASAQAGAVLLKLKLKKCMKRILFCLVAALFATAAFAQDGGRHRHRPREFNPEENAIRRTNRLHEAVQLDSLQYQAVYIMYLSDAMTMQDSINARRERAERMREEGVRPQRRRPTEEQMQTERELREARREARHEQMQQILTEEQYERYLQYEEEENRRRAESGPRHRGGNRGGHRAPRE